MAVIVNGFQTTPAGSGTNGDTLLVTGTGIIAYDGDPAIFMSGDNQRTTIFGEVYSTTGRAILSQGLNAKVYVATGPTFPVRRQFKRATTATSRTQERCKARFICQAAIWIIPEPY